MLYVYIHTLRHQNGVRYQMVDIFPDPFQTKFLVGPHAEKGGFPTSLYI